MKEAVEKIKPEEKKFRLHLEEMKFDLLFLRVIKT